MADHQMNRPVGKLTPEVPGDAAARIKAAQLRAEKQLTDDLGTFWRNRRIPEQISPMDLVPMFQRYAEKLFGARAEEYLRLVDDAQSLEDFLRWKLPEAVTEEILPPVGGSKRPELSDAIGLRETLCEYKDRIDKVGRSAEPSESEEIWERVTGIPFADVRAGFSKADEIWEKSTGEAAGYDVGFSKTEGTWEKLMEDACVRAIRSRSIRSRSCLPYSAALVWALRDSRNRSDVREILLVSLQEQWREFVASWLEQAVTPNPIGNSAPNGVTPAQPKTIGGNDRAKWNAIEISFLSEERVQIRNGTSIETRNYGELGFADRRAKQGNPKPNQAWAILRVMAEQKGIIRDAAKTAQDWPKVEKRMQEIRKIFRKHFGIDSDPVRFVAGTGYRTLFKIGCGPSYNT